MTAAQVLDKYWPEGRVPIEPVLIASRMGVFVVAVEGLPVSGHYRPNVGPEKHDLICYKAEENYTRQRFTIAHELGHKVLHGVEKDRETPPDFMSDSHDPDEVEANRFAAELLMPEDYVRAAVDVRGIKNLAKLAGLFLVSTGAMKWRLTNLGYDIHA